jgi:hypothetical protein
MIIINHLINLLRLLLPVFQKDFLGNGKINLLPENLQGKKIVPLLKKKRKLKVSTLNFRIFRNRNAIYRILAVMHSSIE